MKRIPWSKNKINNSCQLNNNNTKMDDTQQEPSEQAPLLNNEPRNDIIEENQVPIRQRNRKRKNISTIEMILLIIVIALSIYICIFGIISTNNKRDCKPTEPKECLKPECILTAARIINNMDTTVDPCDDFYQFTCGNWMEENVIPEDKTRISTFDSIFKKNINILRNSLESEYKPSANLTKEEQEIDKITFTQLQNIYNTCMNTEAIETQGVEPLTKLLQKLFSSKAELLKKIRNVDEFSGFISALHAYGFSTFFDMGISSDQKDPDINVIYLGQSGLGLPSKEYYEEEETLAEYEKVINQMFTNYFEENHEKTNLGKLVVEFEKKLAKVTVPSQDMQDPKATYNEFTIKKLNKDYPSINWTKYFKSRFKGIDDQGLINDDTLVIVNAPTFFEGLTKLIDQKELDVESIIYYIYWNVIRVYGKYLNEEFQEPLKKLRKILTGVQIDPPRYEYCVRIVDGMMGMAASKLFIEKAFAGDSKEAAEKTIEYIKEAMNFRIPQMTWLDRKTRNLAIQKVFALTNKIGYPDFVLKPNEVRDEYANLEISDSDFFVNIVNSNTWDIEKNLKDIKKKVDRSKWEMTPQTVNAYYNPPLNEIVFPAGILQTPFFNSKDPYYLNYGGIGAVVGHELTHAFDNNGRQYDFKGRLNDWWSNSTLEEFTKLTQCFIDQYESFTIEDKKGKKYHVNGKLTLGENLADNGGLARAYEAWKISLEKDEASKSHNQYLPGLSQYTFDQLFYISFGQIWCSKSRPESAVQRIRTDPHSPPQHRVNGAVSNSEHFAQTFACAKDAPMNPEKKCSIW